MQRAAKYLPPSRFGPTILARTDVNGCSARKDLHVNMMLLPQCPDSLQELWAIRPAPIRVVLGALGGLGVLKGTGLNAPLGLGSSTTEGNFLWPLTSV